MHADKALTHLARTRSESVAVLIVGAGAAGLTLSLLLARFGIESMIVERRTKPSVLPRATGVNVRSMEIFRGLGLEAAIDGVSMPTDVPFLLVGEALATAPRETVESDHWRSSADRAWPSPCHARWCAQDQVEAVLIEALRREEPARLRWGWELVSVHASDDAGAVIRDVRSSETRTVRARYLIGADGANSRVRETLGIAMRGEDGLSSDLNILFRADLERLLNGRRFCMYRIHSEHVSGVLRPTGRADRWLFDTPASAPTSQAQCIESIRAAAGDPTLAVEIVATGAWRAAARVAESFRHGPVLLLGDAAHQHTPGGGFGMNSAIQGAHNVAWKLAAVLEGAAAEGLLDSYQTERQPLAELTTRLSVSLLQARGRNSARTLGLILGACIENGSLIPDGTAPPHATDPVADYVPSARPGHRAPHIWLDDAKTTSTLDLFGDGFVLLTPTPDLWEAPTGRASTPGVSLRVRQLRSTEACELHGVKEGGAVLVRPDGYVAARWPTAPAAIPTVLETAFAELLGLSDRAITGFDPHFTDTRSSP